MLGERLKKLRGKRSQKDIAERVGVARTTYTGYENGFSMPERVTLVKLAEIFDVSVDYLLGLDDKEREEMKAFESPAQYQAFKESVSDPHDNFFIDMYLNASEEDKKRLRDFYFEHIYKRKE